MEEKELLKSLGASIEASKDRFKCTLDGTSAQLLANQILIMKTLSVLLTKK